MIDLIMIQRIQTVYLFLSALFTALLLFLPLTVGVPFPAVRSGLRFGAGPTLPRQTR